MGSGNTECIGEGKVETLQFYSARRLWERNPILMEVVG